MKFIEEIKKAYRAGQGKAYWKSLALTHAHNAVYIAPTVPRPIADELAYLALEACEEARQKTAKISEPDGFLEKIIYSFGMLNPKN